MGRFAKLGMTFWQIFLTLGQHFSINNLANLATWEMRELWLPVLLYICFQIGHNMVKFCR